MRFQPAKTTVELCAGAAGSRGSAAVKSRYNIRLKRPRTAGRANARWYWSNPTYHKVHSGLHPMFFKVEETLHSASTALPQLKSIL